MRQGGALPSCILEKPEIGLCFFEAAACLDYGPEDLPLKLVDLPCSWHVHLPLDLPFCMKPAPGPALVRESFSICRRLMQKCEFLNIRCAVLHPPAGRLLEENIIQMTREIERSARAATARMLRDVADELERRPN